MFERLNTTLYTLLLNSELHVTRNRSVVLRSAEPRDPGVGAVEHAGLPAHDDCGPTNAVLGLPRHQRHTTDCSMLDAVVRLPAQRYLVHLDPIAEFYHVWPNNLLLSMVAYRRRTVQRHCAF